MLTPEENKPSPETEKEKDNSGTSQPSVNPTYNPYLCENTSDTNTTADSVHSEEKVHSESSNAAENNSAQKRCPYCGRIVREDAKFCVSCGKSLRNADAPYHSAPNQEYTASPASESVPQYTKPETREETPEKLGVIDYLLMIIGFNIPLLGLILQLYWSFSSATMINRRNFSRAFLIMRVMQYVLIVLYVVLIFSAAGGLYDSFVTESHSLF